MYSSLSQLGLSGSVTLEEVRAAMQVKSMLIIVSNQSQPTSDYVSDTPPGSGTLIIIKLEPNYYTHAEFIKATDGSTIRYFNLYTVGSGWNGWNTNFLPLSGGVLNGNIEIHRSTYPTLHLISTTNNTRSLIISGTHNIQLETRDVKDDASNRRTLVLTDATGERLYKAIQMRDTVNSTDKWYYIYGSHNITSGTSPKTAGTTVMDPNTIYLQYE